MLKFLMNLGNVTGLTFRADVEDGVGVVISPNPNVTRMQPNAVPVDDKPRKIRRRASGHWSAKPLHMAW